MDNASYHTVQINKIPNTSTRKTDIQHWLRANHIMFEENQTRSELLVLIQKYKPEPVYEADEMLKEHGHEVLRLPPYHGDLNPIELISSASVQDLITTCFGEKIFFVKMIKLSIPPSSDETIN